jgi:hypothetical protein
MANLGLIFLISCAGATLLGHYKPYDSGGRMLYDFSGNGRHAQIQWSNQTVLTDRGIFLNDKSIIIFPSNEYSDYPGSSRMFTTIWVCVIHPGTLFEIVVARTTNNSYKISIEWVFNNQYVGINYRKDNTSLQSQGTTIPINQWNLITFQVAQVLTDTEVKIYNGATATPFSSFIFKEFNFAGKEINWRIRDQGLIQVFLYEVWWRDDIPNDIVSSLSTILNSRPVVLASPPQTDRDKTYNGIPCDSSCTSISRSCKSTGNTCINVNIGANCGWYEYANPKFIPCSGKLCSSYNLYTKTCSRCISNLELSNNSCSCSSDKSSLDNTGFDICYKKITECLIHYFDGGCYKCSTFYVHCSSATCTFSNETCTSACPSGYTPSNSNPLSCKACANTAKTYLKSGTCVASCGSGYYQDPITMTCFQCSSNCLTCSDTGCSQCDNSTFLKLGECVSICGIGYYIDTSNRLCIQCSANCNTCSEAGCSQCINSTYIELGVG